MLKRLLIILLLAIPAIAQSNHLNAWFRSYNERYFNNELPQDVVITRNLNDSRFMALTEYKEDGFYHIKINPKYNPTDRVERLTLLHESCHIRLSVKHEEEFDDHGPLWQHCMQDLAKKGAFSDLW
jgi:hypothetical protein